MLSSELMLEARTLHPEAEATLPTAIDKVSQLYLIDEAISDVKVNISPGVRLKLWGVMASNFAHFEEPIAGLGSTLIEVTRRREEWAKDHLNGVGIDEFVGEIENPHARRLVADIFLSRLAQRTAPRYIRSEIEAMAQEIVGLGGARGGKWRKLSIEQVVRSILTSEFSLV